MFLFSQECPLGGHTSRRAQPESFDYYRFTGFFKIAELNITISSGLHLFTKNWSYYPACSKNSNRIIARKLERGQGGYARGQAQ